MATEAAVGAAIEAAAESEGETQHSLARSGLAEGERT
jgi:hypothetical protein